jgi:hypothetical protein
MKELTPKQEKFCNLYIELGNASDAYRQSYNTKADHKSVNVRASELLKKSNITVRVKQLQKEVSTKHTITIDSLLNELEVSRACALACETPQTSAAISATMAKAKLCGLDKQVTTNDLPVTLVERVIIDPKDVIDAIKAKHS